MDDPIFDPWAIRKPDSGEFEKIEHGGRRQSGVTEPASGDTRTFTPAGAPVVRRWVVPASRVTPSEAPAPARRVGRIESEQTIAEPLRGPEPSAEPRRSPPQSLPLRRLQEIARPRLEEVQARLHLAGHQASLADLTDREAPSLRFRFVPHRGAFEERWAVEGSVLEFVWEDGAGHVSARFWLDPMAKKYGEEATTPLVRFDRAWVDRVILKFVARVLRTEL